MHSINRLQVPSLPSPLPSPAVPKVSPEPSLPSPLPSLAVPKVYPLLDENEAESASTASKSTFSPPSPYRPPTVSVPVATVPVPTVPLPSPSMATPSMATPSMASPTLGFFAVMYFVNGKRTKALNLWKANNVWEAIEIANTLFRKNKNEDPYESGLIMKANLQNKALRQDDQGVLVATFCKASHRFVAS